MTETNSDGYSSKKTLLISVGILLFALILSWLIFSTEPEAQREGATRKTPMLVETTPVEIGDFTPTIEAMGTVRPSREIQLQARVSGQVLSVADAFIPGQTVKQGSTLLQLDPVDYQNQLKQSQSDLNQAQSDLQIEMGEQLAAQQDYQRLNREMQDPQKSLILRKPQLSSAKAQVAASEALTEQAKLNLQRTQITAPFDAQIQNIYVNLGSQVNNGTILADLVGVGTYWIEATVPVHQLQWINTKQDKPQSEVKIRNELAWPDQVYRQGTLLSVIGQIDDATRMARLLIAVEDPIGLKDTSLPGLTIGAYVACLIPAKSLTDVARIDRQFVRKNDTLWLMQNQQLKIKPLNVIFRDKDYLYVRDSLKSGDQIVTTKLSSVTEGAPLRLNSQESDVN